ATFLEIAGYTDSMKDKNAAYALSLDMAQRTGVYFAQHNVSTSRMFIVGRGAARPIAAQDDIGRLTNRRVEIRISPAR
ncbi:MAG: OmpA family protein, partial [Neisseriaceae bacterium]|nr:OmpA family protein [Neisseriaceae bacterium]